MGLEKYELVEMWISLLVLLYCVDLIFGNYCNTEECPGFSIISSWEVKSVDEKSLEIEWESLKEYANLVHSYEVHWLSSTNCTKCNGKIGVNKQTNLKIAVDSCVNYTLEIYPLDSNNQSIKAPAIFSQVSASNSLKNGSALIIGPKWAVLRWLEEQPCLNSSYIAICHGPNTITHIISETVEGVVLVNISGLLEQSDYVCSAHTVNPAGTSIPSEPIFFTTNRNNIIENEGYPVFIYILPPGLLLIFIISVIGGVYFLQNLLHHLPWRGSYSINATREQLEI